MSTPRAVREVYLDNNATTPALPEVVEAVARAMVDDFGNPSSAHGAGARARTRVQRAREEVAAAVGGEADQVLFTSGATEANNIVLQSLLRGALRGYDLITTAVEHSSIRVTAERLQEVGASVTVLEVDRDGLVDVDAMIDAIRRPGHTLVSIQWANNETGVIQPILALAIGAHDAGAMFHTDAVQAVGKLPVDLREVPVDLLTLAGHKVHAPLGVGAIVGPELRRLAPVAWGGSQETSLRPGTENVPAIVGLGVALRIRTGRLEGVSMHTGLLRDRFEAELLNKCLAAGINGGAAVRLPNTTNVRFREVDGEALTIRLDGRGVRCSQNSACTSQKPEPSYVLRAMGLTEEEAYASIRFSFSELNTMADVDYALEAVADLHSILTRYAVA